MLATPEILSEYREVLGRPKFGLPPPLLARWFALLDSVTVPVIADIPISYERDQKDAKFLVCALAAQTDFLITGDQDFSQARKLVTTTILSMSEFKRLVCDVVP